MSLLLIQPLYLTCQASGPRYCFVIAVLVCLCKLVALFDSIFPGLTGYAAFLAQTLIGSSVTPHGFYAFVLWRQSSVLSCFDLAMHFLRLYPLAFPLICHSPGLLLQISTGSLVSNQLLQCVVVSPLCLFVVGHSRCRSLPFMWTPSWMIS